MVPKRDAYLRIRDMIFEGEIRPGTHLVERKLAEQLTISRVPVREALQRLVLEGVLQNVPGKGLVTRTYDEQELLDLYLYREPLDGMAARLFAQRGDRVEIEFLDQLFAGMEQQVEQHNLDALHRHDFEFHRAIARGSRSPRLYSQLSDLYQECLYVTKTCFSPMTKELTETQIEEMRSDLLAEHHAIYQAILDRDGPQAEETARASVRAGMQRFIRRFAAERIRSLGE